LGISAASYLPLPGGHVPAAVQAAEEVDDEGERGFSSGQDVHDVAPAASEYVDSGHTEQGLLLVTSLNSPASHCWQSTAPLGIVGATSFR
jgi:hypothetical protein